MFSMRAVKSAEYYIRNADEVEKPKQAGRDHIAYYTDGSHDEPPGVVFVPTLKKVSEVAFRFAKDWSVPTPDVVRAWSAGKDAETNADLVTRQSKDRRAFYDFTFRAPKSVGVFRAAGDVTIRGAVDRAMFAATRETVQWLFNNGHMQTRFGQKKKEAIDDFLSIIYAHNTSREGDPLPHHHLLLAAFVQCSDGKMRAFDNSSIVRMQKAISQIHNCSLANNLVNELAKSQHKISIIKDDKADGGFHIAGVPDSLCEIMSKRRKNIEDWMESHTGDRTTAGKGAVSDLAATDSRRSKKDVPTVAELDAPGGQWSRDFAFANWSRAAVLESVRQAAVHRDYNLSKIADAGGVTVEQMLADDRRAATLDAIEALEQTESALSEGKILKAVFEAHQGLSSISEIDAELAHLLEAQKLKEIGRMPNGERAFCSPQLEEAERRMLLEVGRRRNEDAIASADFVEREIAACERKLKPEQAAAVRYACAPGGGGGIAVIEGAPGAGKTVLLDCVKRIYQKKEFTIHGVAPSHRAKDVLGKELGIEELFSKALAGFVLKVTDKNHKDYKALTPKDVVILDECGMCSARDMEKLIANLNGARLICSGDTRQLQPVGAGGPMLNIVTQYGCSRVNEIQRQLVDWQRAASMQSSTGKGGEALAEYNLRGNVDWCSNRADAIASLAAKVSKDIADYPDNTPENLRHLTPRIVIASRNKDVAELNAALRPIYREHGLIKGDDFSVNAVARGSDSIQPISIAKGDRLILGEKVTLGKVQLNNGTFFTVDSISKGKEVGNPLVRLKTDDGKVYEANWNDFVGRRDITVPKEKCVPLMSHGFACTVHASQGDTSARAFVFDGAGGMSAEHANVAMTRHRLDCNITIDTSVIKTYIADKNAADQTVRISKDGQLDALDPDDVQAKGSADITLDEIKDVYKKHYSQSGLKTNISSFSNDVGEWMNGKETLSGKNLSVEDEPDSVRLCDRWFLENGGYENLSKDNQTFATAAWEKWREKPGHNYSLESYVAHTQALQADRRAELEDYDDTRKWTDKSGPWVAHNRLPNVPEPTPELLGRQMANRLADPVAFPVPSLTAVPLPPEIEQLAASYDAQQAQMEAPELEADPASPAAEHDEDCEPEHDDAADRAAAARVAAEEEARRQAELEAQQMHGPRM